MATIDTETGTLRVIGPIGFPDIDGFGFTPDRSKLFATSNNSSKPASLIEIDLETGRGKLVMKTEFPFLEGIAFDPVSPKP